MLYSVVTAQQACSTEMVKLCFSVVRLDEWQQSRDVHPRLKNHYSVDSLITTDVTGSITDIDGCFMAQCNQIFIGMITMQYQAKQVRTSAILTYNVTHLIRCIAIK